MRNMSFALTTDQVRAQTKDVTRRLGWKNLKPGDCFRMVVKAQGLKKGEKVKVLGYARVVSNDAEALGSMRSHGMHETDREGFPGMECDDFVAMFARNMGCDSSTRVQRIEFEYVTKDVAEAWERSRKAKPRKELV
jgi:hypothetical protein